jgi:hypothetical protein
MAEDLTMEVSGRRAVVVREGAGGMSGLGLPPCLRPAQVAELLGLPSARAFAARRRRLEAAGFPPPLPGLGPVWDPLAIEAWRRRQAGAPAGEADVEQLLIARARSL